CIFITPLRREIADTPTIRKPAGCKYPAGDCTAGAWAEVLGGCSPPSRFTADLFKISAGGLIDMLAVMRSGLGIPKEALVY
ncbi:hypothetical protein, partial [Klebsiella pneumoniae]|uniref:hypothetical protein n=1 Tax=Klebsiella pneumoniae TaxID=573 RepID=UPI0021086EAA